MIHEDYKKSKSWGPEVKVYSNVTMSILLRIVYGCFPNTKAE